MSRDSALVVGAGAAGLQAACILAEQGLKVEVLEARERVGGRIWTIHPPELDVPLELGAEFVHGRPAATWDLIRRAGLTAYDIPFNHVERRGRQLSRTNSFEGGLDRIMGGLKRIGKDDMSFSDYLRHYHPGQNPAVHEAMDFVRGFDAADPEIISGRSLAEEHLGAGNMDQTQYRLLQGYGAAAEFLGMYAQERGAAIHLKTAASEIRWRKHEVIVRTRDRREFHGKRAIVALPAAVLSLPPDSPGALRWDPMPRNLAQNLAFIAPGAVIKVVVVFDEAFWEGEDFGRRIGASEGLSEASFMHARKAAIPVWWTALPLRVPVLTGWKGGPGAAELSGRGEKAIREAAFRSLAVLLGVSAQKIRRKVDAFHFHDWSADPFSREAYSYLKVGGDPARRALARPVDGTLFLAGEAFDVSGQASTVAGALASGKRAARQLIASL